jgi:DNA-binding NtrC family response regulator
MKNRKVLIVCDETIRRNFMEHHLTHYGLEPVSYPNFLSAKKALGLDAFGLIVIDLQMPLEQKLALLQEACKQQKEALIVTLEKVEYLRSTGILATCPEVICLDSIMDFEKGLQAICGKSDLAGTEG